MNVEDVRAEVDRIMQDYIKTWDDERLHGAEDDLLTKLVREYCPPEIVSEIARLAGVDAQRWCA